MFLEEIRKKPLAEFRAGPMSLGSYLVDFGTEFQDNLTVKFKKDDGLLPENPMTLIVSLALTRASELVSSSDCEKPVYYNKRVGSLSF